MKLCNRLVRLLRRIVLRETKSRMYIKLKNASIKRNYIDNKFVIADATNYAMNKGLISINEYYSILSKLTFPE